MTPFIEIDISNGSSICVASDIATHYCPTLGNELAGIEIAQFEWMLVLVRSESEYNFPHD